jgi:hypothetical protein
LELKLDKKKEFGEKKELGDTAEGSVFFHGL